MRLTRTVKTVAAMAVAAAVGVSAASALVASPSAVVTPHSPVAQPGSDRVDKTAPDPAGGLGWAVRSYASTSGGSCVEAGRVRDGRFGQLGRDGGFRETPVEQSGTCGSLLEEPVLLAINHYPAAGQRGARTVLFGRARPDVAAMHVTGPGGVQRPLVAGAGGGFVLPLEGTIPASDLPVQVTLVTGEQLTFDWR